MKYMLMIYGSDQELTAEQEQAEMGGWFEYDADIIASGSYVASEALQPASMATLLRQGQDRPQVTDGPLDATKRQLNGFYVVDVEHLDEALAWSAKMPHVPLGGLVEIRPIMVF